MREDKRREAGDGTDGTWVAHPDIVNNLVEDAATAEISRSQVWQVIRHGAALDDGATVTRELVRAVLDEETPRIRASVGEET